MRGISGMNSLRKTCKNYLFSPGEQDRNEPEILASILDEFILQLSDTHGKTTYTI